MVHKIFCETVEEMKMEHTRKLRFFPVIIICAIFCLLSIALVGQQFYGVYTPTDRVVDVLPKESFQTLAAEKEDRKSVV